MKSSTILGIAGLVLLFIALALDLVEQIQSHNGLHFRLLHAAAFLLLFSFLSSLRGKSN
jgi:hypothetical protein